RRRHSASRVEWLGHGIKHHALSGAPTWWRTGGWTVKGRRHADPVHGNKWTRTLMKPRPPKKISVVIVEDHPLFRERLAQLINKAPDMRVCGGADNIRNGFALIKREQPSIAIVDITLKGSNGLELIKDLRAQGIDVPVLVLSMHDESLYAE